MLRGCLPALGGDRPSVRSRPQPSQRWCPIRHRCTWLATFVVLWLLVMLLAGCWGMPIMAFLAPRVALAAPALFARTRYFGQVPSNGWIPVEATIPNQDASAFRGHLEVRQLPSGRRGSPGPRRADAGPGGPGPRGCPRPGSPLAGVFPSRSPQGRIGRSFPGSGGIPVPPTRCSWWTRRAAPSPRRRCSTGRPRPERRG